MTDHTPATLSLIAQLATAGNQIPVKHKVGKHTRFLTTVINAKESRESPDPASLTHDFLFPVERLITRTGNNAGGQFKHVVIDGNGRWYDIVRAEGGEVEFDITLDKPLDKSANLMLSSGTMIHIPAGSKQVKTTVSSAVNIIHTGKLANIRAHSIDELMVDPKDFKVEHKIVSHGYLAMGDKDLPTWMY